MNVQPSAADPQEHTAAGQALDDRREQAIKRINAKNAFKVHLTVYLLVNAMLVVIWAFSGAGFFWPVFVMGFWGIGVVINGYTAYRGNTYTERQIQREIEKLT